MPTHVDTIAPYAKGDRLRADTVNAIVACLQEPDAEREQWKHEQEPYLQPFKNTDAGVAPAGAVLLPSAVASIVGNRGHEVTKPGADGVPMMLVSNLISPTPAAGRGWARWAWQGAWCQYDDADTPARDEVWGTSSGSWLLKKGESGNFVATGEKFDMGSLHLGRFVQHPLTRFRGITVDPLTKGGTAGTVTRYKPGTRDDAGVADAVLSELVTVGADKIVYYFLENGKFYLDAVECPVE